MEQNKKKENQSNASKMMMIRAEIFCHIRIQNDKKKKCSHDDSFIQRIEMNDNYMN